MGAMEIGSSSDDEGGSSMYTEGEFLVVQSKTRALHLVAMELLEKAPEHYRSVGSGNAIVVTDVSILDKIVEIYKDSGLFCLETLKRIDDILLSAKELSCWNYRDLVGFIDTVEGIVMDAHGFSFDVVALDVEDMDDDEEVC
eukprot:742012-Hanusia_phi.AAC.1